MTELYLITLGIIDELQDSILPEAGLWYLFSTIDFVQPMITELQQAEKKAYASNLCIPSNWIHSIKQAHSFAEEFISICKNMIASEYDSIYGTRSEHNAAYFNFSSKVSAFFGKDPDFPTQATAVTEGTQFF